MPDDPSYTASARPSSDAGTDEDLDADPRPRWRRALESQPAIVFSNLVGGLLVIDFLFTHVLPLYLLVFVWGVTAIHAVVMSAPSTWSLRAGLRLRVHQSPFRRPTLDHLGVIAVGVAAAFVALIATSHLSVALSLPTGGHVAMSNLDLSLTTLPLYVLGMLLVVGPAEEYVFRHVLQRRLLDGSAPRRVALSSVAFGGVHVVVYGFGVGALVPVVALTLVGAVLGTAYEITDNLTVPSLVHGLYNSVLFVLLFLGA